MPFEERFRTLLDNVFSGSRPLYSLSEKIWNPPTDVYECEGAIMVTMEIAGVRDEDMQITVENNLLIIRGFREDMHPAPKQNYHQLEIHYGQFERVFRLPGGLDTDTIAADYRQGFLTVRIPRKNACRSNIRIEIQE